MTTDLETVFVSHDKASRVDFTSNAKDRFTILTALMSDVWGGCTVLSHDEEYQPLTVCGYRYTEEFKSAFGQAFDPDWVEPAPVEEAAPEHLAEENGQ
mgnify:CR=1 FL=1